MSDSGKPGFLESKNFATKQTDPVDIPIKSKEKLTAAFSHQEIASAQQRW